MTRRLVVALLVAYVAANTVALGVLGTACPTEDSSYCIWWGPVQGNGKGDIVVNWR